MDTKLWKVYLIYAAYVIFIIMLILSDVRYLAVFIMLAIVLATPDRWIKRLFGVRY